MIRISRFPCSLSTTRSTWRECFSLEQTCCCVHLFLKNKVLHLIFFHPNPKLLKMFSKDKHPKYHPVHQFTPLTPPTPYAGIFVVVVLPLIFFLFSRPMQRADVNAV